MAWFGSPVSSGRRLTFRPLVELLEDRVTPSRIPVLFVPGQPASLPKDVITDLNAKNYVEAAIDFNYFLTHLGTSPDNLTTEFCVPSLGIPSPSNDLLKALRDAGYRDGVDLFAAVHDWRMPVAPLDGANDGFLANTTYDVMTNGQFNYGVSYLGYWIKKAEAAWYADTSNMGLFPGVDIISHSEGNLLVRAYISSAAYLDPRMPKVHNWVAAAPPFQGASGIYNLLKNNFANSLGSDVANGGLYPFIELPYIQVATFGATIYGPNGAAAITRASITDPLTGRPDPYRFMQQYIPSLWAENATYAFLDGQTINNDPRFRNDLMLDLNWTASGAVATGFATQVTGAVSVIYGTVNNTLTYAVSKPASIFRKDLPLIAGLRDLIGLLKPKPWVLDISVPGGDGFLAVVSSAPPSFTGATNINLFPQTLNSQGKPVDHDDTISDPRIVKDIVGLLGYTVPAAPPPVQKPAPKTWLVSWYVKAAMVHALLSVKKPFFFGLFR